MAAIKQAEDAKPDNDKGRSNLDVVPPFGKREQQPERQQYHEDCQQMPD